MTDIEKRQPNSQFIETGGKAYHMGIHVSGNPYKDQPYRDLWEKGWWIAYRADASQRPKNKRPPFKQQGDQGYDRRHRHPKPQERRQNDPQPQNTYNTEKLVTRFNRRNRTAI